MLALCLIVNPLDAQINIKHVTAPNYRKRVNPAYNLAIPIRSTHSSSMHQWEYLSIHTIAAVCCAVSSFFEAVAIWESGRLSRTRMTKTARTPHRRRSPHTETHSTAHALSPKMRRRWFQIIWIHRRARALRPQVRLLSSN